MQILNKKFGYNVAVVIATTIGLSQALVALAHTGCNLGNSNSIIAGISSQTTQDNVLYRPRWSLPSNGVLKKLPLTDEESDDATVETIEKKAVEPKTEAPVKTSSVKKPAISRSERLNLGSPHTAQNKDEVDEPRKEKVVAPAQFKRSASTVSPQPLSGAQTPLITPTPGAPIPGM